MVIEMTATETAMLCVTAFTVGTVHTILGPDHYVPFVAMARAGDWSTARTLRVTAACGLGHVAGSVLIGLVGLAVGVAVLRLEALEAVRGDLAGWLLIGFGAGYFLWGLLRASQRQLARTKLLPAAGTSVWTPWLLLLLFVFGPCEPLIPLLMYPAAKASPWAVAGVVAAFTLATVGTMLIAVLVLQSGAAAIRLPRLDRFGPRAGRPRHSGLRRAGEGRPLRRVTVGRTWAC